MTTTVTTDKSYQTLVKERRSIRVYDTNVKISEVEMNEILEEATLAPSSLNLQPWRFLVIESEEGKEKLKELAKYNAKQVETSSAVIAVFVDLNNAENIEAIYNLSVEKGLMTAEVKEKQVSNIANMLSSAPREQLRASYFIDAGLVSMQIMLSAQARGYASNAMGGYNKKDIAETFGMDKERFEPVMLISIGKAAEAGKETVRLPIADVAKWV